MTSNKTKKSYFEYLILLFLVLIAFLFKAYHQGIFSLKLTYFFSDDAIYMDMARSIFEGNIQRAINPQWPIFYPLVSIPFYLITNNWFSAGILTGCFFNSLLFIPIYNISKKLTNRYFALSSIVLVFLSKYLNTTWITPLSEPLYIFLIWSGLALGIESYSAKKYITPILCGFTFGLSALTKADGILAFASFLAFLIIISFVNFKEKQKYINNKIIKIILVITSFSLIYLSNQYLLFNKYQKNLSFAKVVAHLKQQSPFAFNIDKSSTWAQDIYSLDDFNPNSNFFENNLLFIKNYHKLLLLDWEKRINIFLSTLKLKNNIFSFILFTVGIIFVISKIKKYKEILIIFSIIPTIFFTLFFIPAFDVRLILFSYPLIIPLTVYGTYYLQSFFKNKYLKFIVITIIVTLIFIKEYANFNKLFKDITYKQDINGYLQNDEEFNKLLYNKIVMITHEGEVFNSRSKVIYTPRAQNLDELINYAKLKNTDYIVASSTDVPPSLKFLYEKPVKNNYIRPVLTKNNYQYVIYEIIKNKKP